MAEKMTDCRQRLGGWLGRVVFGVCVRESHAWWGGGMGEGKNGPDLVVGDAALGVGGVEVDLDGVHVRLVVRGLRAPPGGLGRQVGADWVYCMYGEWLDRQSVSQSVNERVM